MNITELFESSTGFYLYIDLDGVLVDFDSGKEKLFSQTDLDPSGKGNLWKLLHSLSLEEAEDWWANLGWAPGGRELWNYVKRFHPTILSTPDIRPGYRQACEKGKMRWIHKHLSPPPANVILTKDKWKHASKFAILIDDRKKVLIPWEEHGGAGIHHETGNPKATIRELVERFGFPKK